LAKSLLNNLLGRFGLLLDKPKTDIVTSEKFTEIGLSSEILSHKIITKDNILVTYIPLPNKEIMDSFNIDITKALEKFSHLKGTKVKQAKDDISTVSVAISACITSYARIHINKLKYEILNSGGKIYYSDTDSIVTDIQLGADHVSNTELGKLKLEAEIKKGIFIGGKTYFYVTQKDKSVIKAKGVKSSSLTPQDFESLYKGMSITSAIKRYGIKNYSEGSVRILEKNITINHDSYVKRNKLLNKGRS